MSLMVSRRMLKPGMMARARLPLVVDFPEPSAPSQATMRSFLRWMVPRVNRTSPSPLLNGGVKSTRSHQEDGEDEEEYHGGDADAGLYEALGDEAALPACLKGFG